jgi:hypothetical protein
MSLMRTLTMATALLAGAPAFAQEPERQADTTIEIMTTSPSGRPTLMSYLAANPLPETVDGLVSRLNAPGVCGEMDWPKPDPDKPCAIIAYYLVDKEESARTPQLTFRAINYVTHPENPLETTVRIFDIDGRLESYSGGRLDEPLRPMRAENSCRRVWDTIKLQKQVKKCKKVDALYVPFGILGYGENESHQILTGKAKELFFSTADYAKYGATGLGEDARLR